MFTSAKAFYDGLIPVCVRSSSSITLFAFSNDQFGFAEMKDLITKTGGFASSHELFSGNVFKDSFKNYFSQNEYGFIDKSFGGRLEVSVSKGMRIQGIVGACISDGAKTPSCSDIVVGEGGTTSWYLGTVDKNSCYALVLENDRLDDLDLKDKNFIIQFRAYYKNAYGQLKLRITTISRRFGTINKENYSAGFDQEAAIVMTARVAMSLSGMMDQKEVTKWIDKRLIKLYHRFGEFNRGYANTFKITDNFTLVPQFFYYLRKSTFILNFAISVDEMWYTKMIFLRENIANSLVMIQPSLLEYNCELEYPEPALCDISSLKDESIILFDTYFNVVVW